MSEPFLSFQAALRARLIGDANLTALVPAASILDSNRRPDVMPCVLIGEGQSVIGETLKRDTQELFLDVHVFTQEAGTAQVKGIVGAIRAALNATPLAASGVQVADFYIASALFMRDPDTVHAHAVVKLHALVLELEG